MLEGQEAATALLNNASRCHRLLGAPAVTVEQMIEWTAHWIKSKGADAQQAHPFRKPGRKILVTHNTFP